MKRIVLASSSPRRRDIIKKLGLKFDIVPSDFEEKLDSLDFEYEKIENLAYNKALDVSKKVVKPSFVIGADTVVVLNNKILGKPKDSDDAVNMLKMLSGKKHSVVTSICIIDSETQSIKECSTTSYVEFENLSDELIENYVKDYCPLDKAGSYGIQELPDGFIKCIDGSFDNIIGLCSLTLLKLLDSFEQ